MRVALDSTPLAMSSGGLRRYASELSRALAENFPGEDFLFVAPPDAGSRSAIDRKWWSLGLNRELARLRADLFHGTNFEVPYIPLRPSVLTLHDLSPWLERSWHTGADRVRRRAPWLISTGVATVLITPTEAIRRQAIEHFRLNPGRVFAVHEAAAPRFRPVAAPDSPPYFLYLGALEPRKNLDMLVDAWRAARREHAVDLIIAGRAREGFAAPRPEPGLSVPGEIPDDQLPALYSGAIAFVYPSFYEGFALPVLEAMQCGAMVIASRDAAISEVAGDAAVLLDPRDRRAWAETMAAAANREFRCRWRARSLARAAEFSWTRTARLTYDVYREAARRFHST